RGALARLERRRASERIEHRLFLRQRLPQRLQRRGAGDLSRGVAAHAVGDGVESEGLVDEVGVFVVRSFLADVGSRPAAEDRHGPRTLPWADRCPTRRRGYSEALRFFTPRIGESGLDVRLVRQQGAPPMNT